ncbi:phage shock protein A [Betaproteobacteria bacterium]|nr:phage shock protein A [Betaproteobacteria bacterium]GHU39921.1 phage shock protein A [Betaproteobacteria bacterium]
MGVIGKIVTLLRGSARELGDSIVDANGARIYEQEVLDARNAIAKAKGELAGVMAKEMQSAREIERVRAEIERLEKLAVEALDKDKAELAEEVAAKIAEQEAELEAQTQSHANYAVQVSRLKDLIKTSEARIREHEREVQIAKTTESVYKATQAISENIGSTGSKLVSARESLDRIKKRHEDLADRMTAAETLDKEFGVKALEAKLAEAGIGENSQRKEKVMERIRARQSAATAISVTGEAQE